MLIGGELKLKGPEFEKKELRFEKPEEYVEFVLNFAESAKEKLHFEVWFKIDESDVTISTDYSKDESEIIDSITVHIVDPEKRKIGLMISVEQARAIKEILERYIDAYYSFKALATERKVKAV